MALIKRSELIRKYGTRMDLVSKSRQAKLAKSVVEAAAMPSVFLSHSRHDQDIVKATIAFFADQGVEVYVDFLDDGMPPATSPETARRIRGMIDRNRKFVMLVSARSLGSAWVPWELGCADGLKGDGHVAVFGVSEESATFSGNEYVGLYSRIVEAGGGGWGVFPPGKTQGTTLADWLKA